MRDVVVLSTQYWDGPRFRKHQFALRFAQAGARVLYVEPTHSVIRSAGYAGPSPNRILGSRLREVGGGVHVLSPHRVLPKPNLPVISALNRRWLVGDIQRAMREAGIDGDALFLVYDVEWAPHVDRLAPGAVVLDLVDDLVDYETEPARREYIDGCIRSLAERADLRVFTTRPLLERYAGGRASLVLPNGYDEHIFSPDVPPVRLTERPGKHIGFVGTLFRYIDYAVLDRVACEIPDATLVLVGRREGTSEGLERLVGRPNVVVHGPVTPAEVPGVIAAFDVCVSPFVAGGVADAVSPLKVYEYLAMGKPVVCSHLAGVAADAVAPLVRFAGSSDDFVAAVRAALERPGLPDGWQAIVSERSWSALAERLLAELAGSGVGR